MSDCQGRCLSCMYQGEMHTGDRARTSCAYILITGHSRLKDAYRRLGVKELTKEVRKALEPANCRCYRKGTQQRDESQKRVPLVSSDPVRARATEARVRANAARKKEEERERILKKEKRSYTKPDKPPTVDPVKGRELYDKGMTDREIANVLGIGPGSVWYWRKMNGLPPVAKNVAPPDFAALWKQGLTDEEIAERSGVSRRTVQTWRYKNKLKPNPKNYVPSQELLERRKKLRELYDRGLNDREIAAATGISEKTAAKFRMENGLPPHPRERKHCFDTKQAREFWEQGMTDPEIAQALGVRKATIWHWRSRAGLTCADYRKRPKGTDWEETGRRMLENGATDREIAEAVGRSVATVCSWRKRRGLDYPGRMKRRE